MAIDLSKWLERRSGRTDRRRGDQRPEAERDRSRIIHSSSFRRLQAKTQVLGITEGDFHRTRLTHTMEVAQIGRGIGLQLQSVLGTDEELLAILPDIPLIETIGFGHDLGHPPFGHGGEIALNYMMREGGGFEGNGQSLRIVSRLEPHTEGHGLDLTRRTLLGMLKYPIPYSVAKPKRLPPTAASLREVPAGLWKPPQCYLATEADVVDWILAPLSHKDRDLFTSIRSPTAETEPTRPRYMALDTSILELADDIAYGTHDFEDGVALELITRDHWEQVLDRLDASWAADFEIDPAEIADSLFAPRRGRRSGRRKRAIGALVNAMVSSVTIRPRAEFESPIVDYVAELSEPARLFLHALSELNHVNVIALQSVQTLEYRGRYIVMSVFEALKSDWKALLGLAFRRQAEETGDVRRAVCDYVAGMTDSFVTRMYERLFVPRHGSVFERI